MFTDNPKTIYKTFAFNYGGRREIQYNIGVSDIFLDGKVIEHELRYGLAFSLERSQSLTTPVEVLMPYIKRFNALAKKNPELFEGYIFGTNDEDWQPVREIEDDEIYEGNFIFFGKKREDVGIEDILDTFEALFPIYTAVLGFPLNAFEDSLGIEIKESSEYYTLSKPISLFRKTNNQQARNRIIQAHEATKKSVITIYHTLIQDKLYDDLCNSYGEESISKELPVEGGRVDIAVKTNDGDIFYEIKTASSEIGCINEAIGQLLYYSYYQNVISAIKLIVVGQAKKEQKAESYLHFLRTQLNLPIEYKQIIL